MFEREDYVTDVQTNDDVKVGVCGAQLYDYYDFMIVYYTSNSLKNVSLLHLPYSTLHF